MNELEMLFKIINEQITRLQNDVKELRNVNEKLQERVRQLERK